uniref:Biogenesis of lysosome-related organelles complex 1 subunit 1 n=1 Tax=Varanus komodoensis TaxID=61221 RepID=A0A8D2JE67_VARKO
MLSRLLREHQAKQSERKELQERRRREAIAAATCLTEALVDHLNVGRLVTWKTGPVALRWICGPLPQPWSMFTKGSCSLPPPEVDTFLWILGPCIAWIPSLISCDQLRALRWQVPHLKP